MTNIKIEILEETIWHENPLGVFEPWHLYFTHPTLDFNSGPHTDRGLTSTIWGNVKKYLVEYLGAHESLLVPCYLWEGPLLALSTSPFHGDYAHGQVGFFYVTRKKITEYYRHQRIGKRIRERFIEALEDVIVHLNQYINKEVDYGFVIQQVKHLGDSSGEHYSSREEALDAAEEMIEKLGVKP